MIVRYSCAAWSSASSSPSGIHTSLANSSSNRCRSRSPRTSRHRSRRPFRTAGCDDAVVGARLQVHGRAAGHVARRWRPGDRLGEELLGERGQDHVGHGRGEGVADEPSAERAVGVLADAVGFHARLLEQPPVDGELPLDRVLGLRQRDVSVDRPPFGVLAVEGLVERDAEAAEHRAALEPAGDDLLAGSEQRVGVEVDRPGVDLDVPGVRQARADQRPHRVQALEDRRPVIGQVLVDGVELPSLGGRAVQLLPRTPPGVRGPVRCS